ncbi:hypothetical protein NQZ68_034999 [Dissostichus eleginoides]|nr:hypothetical protein NQZ68_034999 [Dissostichus eleginoides]
MARPNKCLCFVHRQIWLAGCLKPHEKDFCCKKALDLLSSSFLLRYLKLNESHMTERLSMSQQNGNGFGTCRMFTSGRWNLRDELSHSP